MTVSIDRMMSPLNIGGKTMRNRIVHAPMSVGYADSAGIPLQTMVEHYGRRAQGGVGMVITENVAISTAGRQMPHQPMLSDRRRVPAFAAVAAEIKRHGALAVMQIVHAGRYAGPWDVYESARRLAPSAVSFPLLPGRVVTPDEITAGEIKQCIDEFVETALSAEQAGFDGVELHAAQGFLISSFLSPRLNRRTDQWGGSFENRIRLLMEVLRRVRAVVAPSFIVGVHLISDELAPGGWAVSEAIRLSPLLEDAGADFIMPVVSTFETLKAPENAGLMNTPFFQHSATAAIKKAVGIPVFTNGRIDTPEAIDTVLAAGEADAVGLARPLFADPDWVAKVIAGRVADIRVCGCPTSLCLRTQLTGSVCECWPDPAKQAGFLGYERSAA
ncbi:NADH:flavin oxidoreductase [Rhizobium rhizogenes]|uniref:2,4-dienoyl-CoA reductase (NADPH) protein n=1 Tax=Rhizobium rhizogenes (strain K84 / ATCC BAA-868) TaxID=311403 RepID=B9JML9_RHIR8|nr:MULTISPECIES: NADH:flavin oxidoreductase [Rhizobium]ACM28800.1 2,4-dienoyl-CoA reductase (NADPH) protein [Rhizobium rhizogenes K84]OCJ18939.1 2,4-dienoyl-CoA reductase [Agrobacterium sp. B131/95]EJK88096.1 NADH:flavin oxidoreductase [Rhizobium sp. AP16]NTI24471.1 NADH:flavin oxidoreductase [Rhizobium rhizogenes]NTI43791.1 NADH:flavin oxidoreductase [Rhizobium rhizogenes]